MFEDTGLWMVLGSMASTAGLLGFWFDRTCGRDTSIGGDWPASQLD